jgi:hypothetical protein
MTVGQALYGGTSLLERVKITPRIPPNAETTSFCIGRPETVNNIAACFQIKEVKKEWTCVMISVPETERRITFTRLLRGNLRTKTEQIRTQRKLLFTYHGLGGRGSIPGRENKFFSTPQLSHWLWDPLRFLYNEYRGLYLCG